MSVRTPPHVDERSIFSFTPLTLSPTAEEVIAKNLKVLNITNVVDCPTEVHVTLPDGVEIQNHPDANGQQNYGLYATKLLKKHTILYKTKGYPIHFKDVDYKLINDSDGTEYQLNIIRHMTPIVDGIGFMISFEVFTNHSCDPSCYLVIKNRNIEADVIALRDIHPNEQITYDYCLFDYERNGK